MHDRPNIDELLRAVEILFDEQLVPTLTGARQYNSRVAANVIRTVRRELQHAERQLEAEWSGLDALLGAARKPKTAESLNVALLDRNAELCERIRAGDADAGEWRQVVMAHVKDVVHGKLEVSNPKWLLPDEG
jgi:hypothetical protein